MAGIVPYNPLHFLRPWRSDVRRDCFRFARVLKRIATGYADRSHSKAKDCDQPRRSLLRYLPDFYSLLRRQVKRVDFDNVKCLVEFRYISDRTVDPVLSR